MKKYALYSLMLVMTALGFTACNDGEDQLTDTTITNYVVLELQGDDFTLVPLGSTYVDAGCKAELGGEDFTSKLVKTGEVDTNTVGFYDITYSGTNPEGYAVSVSRTVAVYDPAVTVSIAGTYSVDMDASTYGKSKELFSARAANYGNTSQSTGITFEEVAPGIYKVNDLLGGWYDQIRAYGSRYAMTGYVSLNPDNTLTLQSSLIAGWGDGLDYIKDTKVDPEAGTISYSLSYAGQIFMDIVLNKD